MSDPRDLLYWLLRHDLAQLVEKREMALSVDDQHAIADHLADRLTESRGRARLGRRLYDRVRDRLTLHWPRWLR